MARWKSRLSLEGFKECAITPFCGRAGHSIEIGTRIRNKELFEYTRGRFVFDEEHELAIRRVKFDMNELAKVVSQSPGSSECVQIEKLPDRMLKKTFLFTMEDGTQVVGKVPNPNAAQAHLTTASEVATMDFASFPSTCPNFGKYH